MITEAIFLALYTLLWLIPVIVIGIVLAELVVELKLVRALGFLMLPITKFGHLRTECGVSFLTAFGSPVAANSMLMEFYNNKLIDRKEVIIASMITAFPAIVMHWPYMLPTLNPLVGFPGVIYFCIIPYYLGIFGPKLGTQIMTLATSLRLAVVVMIIVVLALIW